MATVIIPVYNAVEELYQCILSVIDNTDLERHTVMIIDDCSTDKQVPLFLKDVSMHFPQIKILTNNENLGFSKTCNQGIQESSGDIILLNSDTIVTPFWLEKLSEAASKVPHCATATPLSNNATICSIPIWNAKNDLPKKMKLNNFSHLLRVVNKGVIRQIPVGVGFCLYIKRDVIDAIGLLDEETFLTGYGAENDFCFRARAAGYHHILVCDAYVYHEGEASFLGDGRRLSAESDQLLEEKHGRFYQDALQYIKKNPHSDVWEIIGNLYELYDFEWDKPFVLFISAGDPFSDKIIFRGGTEFHVCDLSDAISDEYNIAVLLKHPTQYNTLVLKTLADETIKEFHFHSNEWILEEAETSEYLRALLHALIDALPIEIVHVQHWYKLTLDVFYVPLERDLPLLVTLHDYYALCPVYDFLPDEEHYCRYAESVTCNELCSRCCKKHGILDFERIQLYREKMQDILSKATRVYAPSKAAKDIIAGTYDISNITVIPHGSDDKPYPFVRSRSWGTKPYRVAMIGVCSKKKGSANFFDMVRLSAYEPIEWHVFGPIVDKDALEFIDQNPGAVVTHGLYPKGDISLWVLPNKIDLIVISSVWPETFSYTLSEAFHMGIPVIGWDIGAIGERIKECGFGILIPPFSPPEVMLRKILDIFIDKTEYTRLRSAFLSMNYKTVKEMGQEYLADYKRVTRKRDNLYLRPEAVQYIAGSAEMIRERRGLFSYTKYGEKHDLNDLLKQDSFATKLYYRRENQPFSEGNVLIQYLSNSRDFDVNFDISSVTDAYELRWDAGEEFACSIKIDGITLTLREGTKVKYPIDLLIHNGVAEDTGMILFAHKDPQIMIRGKDGIFSLSSSIRIFGQINFALN